MLRQISPDLFQPYLSDASNFCGTAEGVVFAQNEQDAAGFLKECSVKKRPVTVAGMGTGLTGGRVPLSGWVLATDKFSKIKEIHRDPFTKDSFAIVEPGTSWKALHDAADEAGLYYPPDPTSFKSFLGGNVATNASGPCSFKYGPTRNYVRRLRMALASGEVIEISRGKIFASREGVIELPLKNSKIKIPVPTYKMPEVKHVAGYFAKPGMDAIDLFIGAEGTLGVVTEIEVRLIVKPAHHFSFIVYFKDRPSSWRFTATARYLTRKNQAGQNDAAVQARAIEYMDGPSLDLIRKHYPEIPREAQAAIFMEQECQHETQDILWDSWQAVLEKEGAITEALWFADTEEEYRKQRAFRHQAPLEIRELLPKLGQSKVGTDMALPAATFEEFLLFQEKRLAELGMANTTFGHIGDCHLHLNILPKSDAEHEKAWALYRELITKTLSLGGSISGEHGIGKLKREYLLQMFGQKGIDEMRAVKRALDPENLLAPGNLFKIEGH